MRRCIQNLMGSLLVLLLAVIAQAHAIPQQSSKPAPTSDRPIVEIDLHKFVYANPPLNGPSRNGSTLQAKIDFAHENSLIFTWMTQDYGYGKAPKDIPFAALKGQLHSIRLDATTGREEARRDWPVPITWSVRSLVNDGKFVVCIDNKVQLFSANFEQLAELELPAPSDCRAVNYLRRSSVSPDAKFLALSLGIGENYKIENLDPDTLQVISTTSVGKSFVSRGRTDPRSAPAFREVLNLDDDTRLMRESHRVTVTKTDGEEILDAKLPNTRTYGDISVVEGRFAVMENRLRGIDSSFLDESKQPSQDEIVVYDTPERRAIFALRVKGYSAWPLFIDHHNEFALSPDGNRLAVVSDGILKIYKLPARQSAR